MDKATTTAAAARISAVYRQRLLLVVVCCSPVAAPVAAAARGCKTDDASSTLPEAGFRLRHWQHRNSRWEHAASVNVFFVLPRTSATFLPPCHTGLSAGAAVVVRAGLSRARPETRCSCAPESIHDGRVCIYILGTKRAHKARDKIWWVKRATHLKNKQRSLRTFQEEDFLSPDSLYSTDFVCACA